MLAIASVLLVGWGWERHAGIQQAQRIWVEIRIVKWVSR